MIGVALLLMVILQLLTALSAEAQTSRRAVGM